MFKSWSLTLLFCFAAPFAATLSFSGQSGNVSGDTRRTVVFEDKWITVAVLPGWLIWRIPKGQDTEYRYVPYSPSDFSPLSEANREPGQFVPGAKFTKGKYIVYLLTESGQASGINGGRTS